MSNAKIQREYIAQNKLGKKRPVGKPQQEERLIRKLGQHFLFNRNLFVCSFYFEKVRRIIKLN